MTRSTSIVPASPVQIDVGSDLNMNETYGLALTKTQLTNSKHTGRNVTSSKMNVDTESFKLFYNRVKDQFPYNQLRVTRNRFHVKWLLMTCDTDPGILFHHGRLYPLLCKSMKSQVVQHLIITEQAMPLPQSFSLLMDSMYYWGRSLSGTWFNKTLELINFYLLNSELDAATPAATDLYCDVIQMRVVQMLHTHFRNGHSGIAEAWLQHYNEQVLRGNNQFFSLAVSSIQFTKYKINEVSGLVGTESGSDNEVDEMDVPDMIESSS